jgi:hypothetical protein
VKGCGGEQSSALQDAQPECRHTSPGLRSRLICRMWQSDKWNAQDAAFKFYMAILGVLIFVNQPEIELD